MVLFYIGTWTGCNWYLESLSISHFTTSASFTAYWQGMMSDLTDFLVLIRLRIYWCPHHYEFRNHKGVAWCCYFCNWYRERWSLSNYTRTALITEYWQGMMSDLECFLFLILLRTNWCQHHYEFGNYNGVAWWYNHVKLVWGEVEYITLHYKCFHHWVLAGNDVRFDVLPGFDPSSKSILVPTPF